MKRHKKILRIGIIVISVIIFIIGIIVLKNSDFDFKQTILGLGLLFLSNGLFVSQIIQTMPKGSANTDFLNVNEDEMQTIVNTINMMNNSNS